MEPAAAVKRKAGSRTDYVAEQLRQSILRHDLLPGDRLHQAELCKRFGVSQTPMREALARLAGEGWVDYYSQRGARVSEVSQDELDDLYSLRELLEPMALEKSLARADEEWLQALDAAYTAMAEAAPEPAEELSGPAYEEYETCHVGFHVALLSACGSPWLIRFTTTLIEQSGRFRRMSLGVRRRGGSSVAAEHEAIYRAARSGDSTTAVRLIREHAELTRESLSAAAHETSSAAADTGADS